MNTTTIMQIPLTNLYHNPNNPRKQIGDVTELADSIRAMGILQNMTVVPFDPVIHAGLEVKDPTEAYVVLIGNRRLEGGKKAKIATAPCIIMEGMSASAQMGIMLVENNQREDLSYSEQAFGFQYMLDMGDSVEEVSQKTGFSTTTVRTRVKLLELDQDKFAKAEKRGATLSDYMKLYKIQDPELRNSVIDSIGTANFNYSLKSAMDTEKQIAFRKNRQDAVQAFAKKIDNATDTMKSVASYYSWEGKKEVERPADADTVEYFYTEVGGSLYIYREKLPGEIAEETANTERNNKFRADSEQLKAIHKRIRSLREDFIMAFTPAAAKRKFSDIAEFSFMNIVDTYYFSEMKAKLVKFLEVPTDDDGSTDDGKLREAMRRSPEYTALVFGYVLAERKCDMYVKDRYCEELKAYTPIYKNDDNLDYLYMFLEKLGYVMSDEEKQLQNGTHPLFYVAPEVTDAKAA